jgi:hypothetical protein
MVAGNPGIQSVFYSRMEEARHQITAFINALENPPGAVRTR